MPSACSNESFFRSSKLSANGHLPLDLSLSGGLDTLTSESCAANFLAGVGGRAARTAFLRAVVHPDQAQASAVSSAPGRTGLGPVIDCAAAVGIREPHEMQRR
jgi:hypothetical protein